MFAPVRPLVAFVILMSALLTPIYANAGASAAIGHGFGGSFGSAGHHHFYGGRFGNSWGTRSGVIVGYPGGFIDDPLSYGVYPGFGGGVPFGGTCVTDRIPISTLYGLGWRTVTSCSN